MEYRVTNEELLKTLSAWDELLPARGKIHLIACGGTALTLLGYKTSTKVVDFLVPNEKEYKKLVKFLKRAGYVRSTGYGWKRPDEVIIYDLYMGNSVYTTALLTSPLRKEGNRRIREWKRIYLGALNPIDLIITKIFRGAEVDFEDSLELLKREKIDLAKLGKRFKETAKYEVGEGKVLRNFALLLTRMKQAGLKK